MASSSSSPSPSLSSIKHDVFLSFRGKDIRHSFISHLYHALQTKKTLTFIDNQLNRGDEVSPSLLEAIEESKISVIVFSKNYADSKWCLAELLKILDCRDTLKQTVIPVFYRVPPTDVRNQTGKFGKAFDKFLDNHEMKPQWRRALQKAGILSGFESSTFESEAILVSTIVGDVLKKLKTSSNNVWDLEGLVGMGTRVEKIMHLLSIESPEFVMVGIWGMGGIGKTTLADAIFKNISSNFESSSFQHNVAEIEKRCELIPTRDKILCELLDEESLLNIGDARIKDRLSRTRVLVVLDNVTSPSQISDLLGSPDQFGPGSKVIVTTRDKQVLNTYKTSKLYDMKTLNPDEAMQLFSNNAFREKQPPQPYLRLSEVVVSYAQGVALALKVVGSYLCGRNKEFWEDALKKLNQISKPQIMDVLKVSFDGLDAEEKDIFLDIACFFKSTPIGIFKEFLGGCYKSLHSGMVVLADKSLITSGIGKDNYKLPNSFAKVVHESGIRRSVHEGIPAEMTRDTLILKYHKIEMHELLQHMAMNIVLQESEEPGSRSRLWRPEDVYHVLTRNIGTEKIKGIFLDVSKVNEMNLHPKTFLKMCNLKLLNIYDFSYLHGYTKHPPRPKIHFPRGIESLSDELRYLRWTCWPLDSLPSAFCPKNLVRLEMAFSCLKRLWTGTKDCANLKVLDLSFSKQLIEIPDLSKAPKLERLFLIGCTSLVEVSSSIINLHYLTHFCLKDCTEFSKLPDCINLTSLVTLSLQGCKKLTKFPKISKTNLTKLKTLDLRGCSSLEEIHSSIEHIINLKFLDLSGCTELRLLPKGINLNSLKGLFLHGCRKITEFPDISRNLEWLELDMTSIGEEVPSSLGLITGLTSIRLTSCTPYHKSPTYLDKLKPLTPSSCIIAVKLALRELGEDSSDAFFELVLCNMYYNYGRLGTEGFAVRNREQIKQRYINCKPMDRLLFQPFIIKQEAAAVWNMTVVDYITWDMVLYLENRITEREEGTDYDDNLGYDFD